LNNACAVFPPPPTKGEREKGRGREKGKEKGSNTFRDQAFLRFSPPAILSCIQMRVYAHAGRAHAHARIRGRAHTVGRSRAFSRAAVVFCGRCFRFDRSQCFFFGYAAPPMPSYSYNGCLFDLLALVSRLLKAKLKRRRFFEIYLVPWDIVTKCREKERSGILILLTLFSREF